LLLFLSTRKLLIGRNCPVTPLITKSFYISLFLLNQCLHVKVFTIFYSWKVHLWEATTIIVIKNESTVISVWISDLVGCNNTRGSLNGSMSATHRLTCVCYPLIYHNIIKCIIHFVNQVVLLVFEIDFTDNHQHISTGWCFSSFDVFYLSQQEI
jgi:hypothetical protein